MAFVSNPLIVRIFINSTHNGWSERWPILAPSWSQGLTIAAQLAAARRNVMSSNATIEWVSLATITPPYIEQGILQDPLMPLPQWGPASFDMQGVLFYFCAESGRFSNHLFRAVEGSGIAAKSWAYRYLTIPLAPPALPADLSTAPKELLWQNTLSTFRQYVCRCENYPPIFGNAPNFLVEPYESVSYNIVSTRNVGRIARRMSWEAQARSQCPAFSPCGCVVGVNRFGYQIPCRFYAGYPATGIRYYFAPPGATILPFPTTFYCWDRAKENTDHSGPGETRTIRRTDHTDGFAFSSAPGVMWTGNAADFVGQGMVLWTPYTPTPSFLRPACDALPPVVAAGVGGPAWGGPGPPAPAPATPGPYWPPDYFGDDYFGKPFFN